MKAFRFILLITAIAIVACGKGDEDVNKVVAVNSVAISPNGPITLFPGEEVTLTASIEPENSTTRKAEWSSDNSSIATVTATGKVKAIAVGTAIITAKAEDKVATCRIDVTEEIIEAEDIVISPTGPQTLQPGEELQLTATISPENATNQSVIWSSDDRDIAMVDATGLVKAIDEGVAIITASIGKLTATCKLTVAREIIEVTSVEITLEGPITITEGEELQLTATVAPENATNKEVTWSSSDNTIATVSETGLVTAIAAGEATITASAGEASDEIVITVEQPSTPVVTVPEGWIVNGDTATYKVSTTMDFDLEVTFENEVCKTVRFTTLTRESRATDIEAVFPESVLDAFTITGRGTVATIDLLLVAGCKEYFENLTMAEMFAAFGDNTSAILTNWTTSFSVTNLVTGNWDISRFDYFGDIRNRQHIDYLLLDMDRMGITESETEDPLLVPEACQLELLFNKVTGQCEKAYAYMCFSTPTGCQTFVSNYVKTGVTYTRDVAGGQGESVQITLHTISGNVFTGKMRTEIIEMTNDEIIGNVLNLCIK